MTEKLLTTTETCKLLSVSRWTLTKWEQSGELNPIRTKGGHKRYKISEVNKIQGVTDKIPDTPSSVLVYVRVSSHEQKAKGDLDRQKARVLEHCFKQKYNVEHIFAEVGSGMNDKRAKLKRIFHLVRSHQISRVVVDKEAYQYLGSQDFIWLFGIMLESHGIKIEVI